MNTFIQAGTLANWFEQGMTKKQLLQLVNIGDNKLTEVLREHGFTYNKDTKQWEHEGGEESKTVDVAPLNELGIDAVNKNDWRVEASKDEQPRTTKAVSGAFTSDEVDKLKEMIANYDKGRLKIPNTDSRGSVIDALNVYNIGILSNGRKRQSYNLDQHVQEGLEAFAKNMRLSQSDLVELAIVQLLDKYYYTNKGE